MSLSHLYLSGLYSTCPFNVIRIYLTYFLSVRIHVSCMLNLFLSFFFLGSSIFTLQKINHNNALLLNINLISIFPSPQCIHQNLGFHLLQFFFKSPILPYPRQKGLSKWLDASPQEESLRKVTLKSPLTFYRGGTFGRDFWRGLFFRMYGLWGSKRNFFYLKPFR